MRLDEFMHVVSAVADVTGHNEFVVIGSQAILGTIPEPPSSMLESMEADIFALHDSAASDQIDGALGDQSPFHLAHGYYAHGTETTATRNRPAPPSPTRREKPIHASHRRRPPHQPDTSESGRRMAFCEMRSTGVARVPIGARSV